MIEVQLSTQNIQKTIVTFHASSLEYFYAPSNEGGRSFHVGHIKSIELITDQRGRHTLVMTTPYHTFKEEVEERALTKTKELVAEVQQAMTAYR